jgi:nucleoside-diphosphate-sugar epimerase
MSNIVTGAAGFIGSNLVETLLKQGEKVIGIDEVNDYYDPELKRKNLAHFAKHPNFQLIQKSFITKQRKQASALVGEKVSAATRIATSMQLRYS